MTYDSKKLIYERKSPHPSLSAFVNCYWLIDSADDLSIQRQKIVPDGFPEIIFHYGDAYRINLDGKWEQQSPWLLAGQIKKHFFLENTGKSGMVAVKFQPTALTHLFGIDMAKITGQVISLPEEIARVFYQLDFKAGNPSTLFNRLNAIIKNLIDSGVPNENIADIAVAHILSSKGMITIGELTTQIGCSERQLERLFKEYVGLSPKFYSRIIRLGHIFELMQEGDKSWSDLVYDSGFYDQSHFIKNFKEFTGEDPSSYGFDERNMANFHFRKE